MRTDLGFGAAACQAGTGRTHRLKRRRRGRAQRGSTCGSRPLTPAVPERLRGRLWPEATKRIEYGTRVLEGKDNAPRRRMFIGHEPTKGSRAASKGRGSSRSWTGCASGRRLQTSACYDCYVFSAIALACKTPYGNQRQPRCTVSAHRPARSGRRTTDRRPGEPSKGGQPPRVRLKLGRRLAMAGGPVSDSSRPGRRSRAWGGNQGAMGQGRARRPW